MSHASSPPSHFLVKPLQKALRGATSVPGDKSIGHRAVLFAGLAEGQSHLRGLSGGEDNQRTVAALCALGAQAQTTDTPGELLMTGRGLRGLTAPSTDIDCGNSGTSIRLLCGLLAAQPFASRLVGDRYLHARPMRRVADPLRRMGALIDGEPGPKGGEIYPPLRVQGGAALRAIRYESPIASAQVKSAILLAGLYAEGVTTVVEPTRSRDHSERMLRALGVPLRTHDDAAACSLDPGGWDQHLRPFTLTIPGDLSSAAFLLGAALLSPGSDLRITGVGLNPSRTGILDVLAAMAPGAVTVEDLREEMGEPVGTLRARGPSEGLRPVRISGALSVRALDELPLCAALCALAPGESVISDAAELRVKESDRVAATVALLRSFGVPCEERPDGLVVQGQGPGSLTAAQVQSYGDHRIAMAGATLALAAPGESRVEDVGNVATSFPTFAAALSALGAEISVGHA